jgi:hypothetical protein
VKLDGLRTVTMATWPAAVHEGNGTMQMVIDEQADAQQRDALAKILTGRETLDMATMGWVYAAMSRPSCRESKIDLVIDVDGRSGRLEVAGMVSSKGVPIRNPVTGGEHRVRIDFPESFEYKLGEIGSGTSTVAGALPMQLKDSWGLVLSHPSQSQGALELDGQPVVLSSLLRHDRALVLAGLIAVIVLSWVWLLTGAGPKMDMGGGQIMLMAPPWTAQYAAMIFLMWIIMMAAMMLPSAGAPAILLVIALTKQRGGPTPSARAESSRLDMSRFGARSAS